MKLEKFNQKKVQELPLKKYNLLLNDGTFLPKMELEYVEDGPMTEAVYYFISTDRQTTVSPKEINSICAHNEFSYVAVEGGFALTKNGSKVFSENVYGVIDKEEHAQYFIINMNANANSYSPDTIHERDIIECISDFFHKGETAIVTEVRKPKSGDDHGTIEVYMIESKFFEHFTYTGWTEFLKVTESYD